MGNTTCTADNLCGQPHHQLRIPSIKATNLMNGAWYPTVETGDACDPTVRSHSNQERHSSALAETHDGYSARIYVVANCSQNRVPDLICNSLHSVSVGFREFCSILMNCEVEPSGTAFLRPWYHSGRAVGKCGWFRCMTQENKFVLTPAVESTLLVADDSLASEWVCSTAERFVLCPV